MLKQAFKMLSIHIVNTYLIIVSSILILYTKADCTIDVLNDAPIFSKALGSKTIILPNGQRSLTLKTGETIRADCSRQLSIRNKNEYNNYDNFNDRNEFVSSVKLKCDPMRGPDIFSVQKLDPPSYTFDDLPYSSIYVECIQGKWQLYERNITLPNCQTYSSYFMGMEKSWLGSYVAAYVCFDLDGLNTKYIKYLANRGEHKILSDKPMMQNLLSTPIKGFDVLFKPAAPLSIIIDEFKNSKPIINIHDFDYLSLVQDLKINEELKDFDYMFKVIWWRSLRLGSWQYFFDALNEHSQFEEYYIYTGTSSIMSIPTTSSCEQFKNFTVKYEGQKISAPELIWAYLKPVKENKTEEFVIIGHNTPFYSAFNSTSFCKDICHEIDWLNGSVFEKIHLLPTFGVVECCRAADVGMKLEGFPFEIIKENDKHEDHTTERVPTIQP